MENRFSVQIENNGDKFKTLYGFEMNKDKVNLVELTKPGGTLYISFPIGMLDEVHFNAHRVFHPKTILEFSNIYKKMKLIRFDYVDDYGNLYLDTSVDNAVDKNKYGCGIYTFKKIIN